MGPSLLAPSQHNNLESIISLSLFPQIRNHRREDPRPYYAEMSSFPETKAEKLITSSSENAAMLLWFVFESPSRLLGLIPK